jgi:hypothetical protein
MARSPKRRVLFFALNGLTLAVLAWGSIRLLGRMLSAALHGAVDHGWVVSASALTLAEGAFIVMVVVMVWRAASGIVYEMMRDLKGGPSDLAALHRRIVTRWPLVGKAIPAPCRCCGRGGPRPWGHEAGASCAREQHC